MKIKIFKITSLVFAAKLAGYERSLVINMINTKVTIAGVEFKNPVMTASGTFGSGMEYSEFVDLNKLGAVVTKGVANVPWEGNSTRRVFESYGGMLYAIGLQIRGIDVV